MIEKSIARFVDLTGRNVLITGGAGYLGRILVQLFSQQGASVCFVDTVDEPIARKVIAESGGSQHIFYQQCDVTRSSEVDAMVANTVAELGGLSILINCAAAARLVLAENMTDGQWDKTLKVSLYGSFYCCRAAFPYLKETRGVIVNVASTAAIIGLPRGTTHHSAAKAGMLGMTRSLAVEWAKYGIRVNGIAPGQFDTGTLREVMKSPDYTRDILHNIPLGRVGTTPEVAQAILFLASDASAFITGHTLVVDGGATIN